MDTSPPDFAAIVDRFIREHFHIADGARHFSRDAHLFEGGYVDSVGMVELLMFVESTFGVKFEDEHIFSDRFTTINGIAAIVATLETEHDDCRTAVP